MHVGGLKVIRQNRSKIEFLIERSVAKKHTASGEILSKILLAPPRAMHHGTGGWCIFEASCEFMELPRQQGNRGLVATTYIQDGLHAESFWRHHEARHKLWYEHSCTIDDENEVWLLQQMDLVFGIECKLHIGARAVKWGQRRMITEGLLDEVHCGIKSLISCSTALREHIPSFLHRVVAYDADRNRWPEQQQRWSSLGVGAEIMELFEEVNPIWDRISKTLHVDASLMRRPGRHEENRSGVDAFFRLEEFHDVSVWWCWQECEDVVAQRDVGPRRSFRSGVARHHSE